MFPLSPWGKIKAEHDAGFREWLRFVPADVAYGDIVFGGRDMGIVVQLTEAQHREWLAGNLIVGERYSDYAVYVKGPPKGFADGPRLF